MEVKEISKKKFAPASESERAKSKSLMEKLRKDGEKEVKGMFEFIDAQGGWISFSYRFWPGEPIRTVKLTHGEICTIPMHLAKHLNNIYTKVRVMPKNLDSEKGTTQRVSRTRFTVADMLSEHILSA